MLKRDGGVQRRQRRARVAERGDRQRDAVRDGEGGDRLHQRPSVADDQQQAEHEEQMVDAEQDVLDAEAHVAERPLPAGRLRAEGHRRVDGLQQVALQPAVRVVHADDDVGDGRFEAVDRQRLARDAAVARQRAADDEGAGRQRLLARRREAALLRDERRDVDLDLAAGRLLPQQAVGLRSGLAQLQEPGPHLVRLGGPRARRAGEKREE